MFSFEKHMQKENIIRCQTKSSSLKMRNRPITIIQLVTLFKELNERKSLTEITNVSKRKKKHLQYRGRVALISANKNINGSGYELYKPCPSCSYNPWKHVLIIFLQQAFFSKTETAEIYQKILGR